jgi:haloacetate dehalogenase
MAGPVPASHVIMMPPLRDLFPGFATHRIDTAVGQTFARAGGAGPPLALLHGFPETHVMWHRAAPELAKDFSVIAIDLRGYGQSSAPHGDGGKALYTKREMAKDVVACMQALGHERFHLAGHDRGGRVAYRLALDHPDRVTKLATLDIVPTLTMWENLNAERAIQAYHWQFLAQPEPMPETLLANNAVFWLEWALPRWTQAKSLGAFDKGALDHYRAAIDDPARIHAMCEDYRAGATTDRIYDAADRDAGRKIKCPMHVLWGTSGVPAKGSSSPLDIWHQTFAPQATGEPIDGGHFFAEENPQATITALRKFFAA